MEEEKQEQKEQDKHVEVPLEDKTVEKEEVTKCCGSSDCTKKGCDDCCPVSLEGIRGFFARFSLGCSSTSCVAVNSKKTLAQTVEKKKEEVLEEKEKNLV